MSLLTPDTGLLFWMTLSFGIVFFLLARYAFPKITGAIEARNEFINNSIEEARKAQQMLAGIETQAQQMTAEAKRERAVILSQAREEKENILAQARQEAEAETAAIREKAQEQIEQYRREAIKHAAEEIVNLSAGIAEKALVKTLSTPDKQKELILQMLDEELNYKNN